MGFETYYRNATKVCERLGTWVLYEVRDARNLDHLIGYLLYVVEDLERLRQQARGKKERNRYVQLIGFWRRAIRWVSSLDRQEYAQLADRLIDAIESHPEHRKLPYYVSDSGHRTLTEMDGPPRRVGRPRTRPAAERRVKDCNHCGGLGRVAP